MALRVDAGVRVSAPGAPGPLRLAFTRAVQDWYYGLIPFAVMNLVWLVLVVTVVAGPPATAAMMAVARDAATGQGGEPRAFFLYLRQFFWRAWGLGLVTLLVSLILTVDLRFYAGLDVGALFLVYVLIVWLEFLLIAWPLLIDQPDMSIVNVIRNAGLLTLRMPGVNFGLALIVILVSLFSVALTFVVALGLMAFVALLAQHYLNLQAPALAGFPTRPGEGATPPAVQE